MTETIILIAIAAVMVDGGGNQIHIKIHKPMKKETYEKAKALQERLDREAKVLNYVKYIDEKWEILIISCGAGSEQLMLPNQLRRQVIDFIKDAISSNMEEINKEFEKL